MKKSRELAKLLAESERLYRSMQAARGRGVQRIQSLPRCMAAFIEKRQQLENETMKDEKDFDHDRRADPRDATRKMTR